MLRFMFLLAIAACSGKGTSDPAHPHPGSNAPADAAVATAGPSERECHDQFRHAAELAAASQGSGAQKPTADDLTRLESELADRYLAVCRAGSLEGHRCAMSATTLAELDSCHATPSSSTSNSKVAPGGMTPAAPRSP